jgi:hypothetical protein
VRVILVPEDEEDFGYLLASRMTVSDALTAAGFEVSAVGVLDER